MTAQQNAFKLGLASLIMVALFVAVLIYISGQDFGPATMRAAVTFPADKAIATLKTGSPVECGGQNVGAVTDVKFKEVPSEDPEADAPELMLVVNFKVETLIELRKDCAITAVGPLLGGSGKLIIRDRGQSTEMLPDGGVIEGKPAGSLDDVTTALTRELDPTIPDSLMSRIKTQLNPEEATSLLAKIHTMLDDFNHISEELASEFDPKDRDKIIQKVHSILDNVNTATASISVELARTNDTALLSKVHDSMDTIETGLKLINAMLEENRSPLGKSLQNVEQLTDQLNRKVVATVVAELEPNTPTNLLGKVHRSLDSVQTSLNDVNVITRDGREVIELNKHRIDTALEDFQATSSILRGGVKYVARHPWVIFNKPTEAEQREMYVVQAARDFAEAATRLESTMADLNAFVKSNNGVVSAGDQQFLQLRETLTSSMTKFNEAESALWQQLGVR